MEKKGKPSSKDWNGGRDSGHHSPSKTNSNLSVKEKKERKSKKAKTVVIIESDTTVLQDVAKTCEDLSYAAVCFTSSVEGKEYVLQEGATGICLVISAMMMPSLSGMQLLQEIRALDDESTSQIPFLLLSSFSKGNAKMQEFQIKTPNGSVVDILIKPFSTPMIVKKIKELAENASGNSGSIASPAQPKKGALTARSPQSARKDYNSGALENARGVKSQPELNQSLDSIGMATRGSTLSADTESGGSSLSPESGAKTRAKAKAMSSHGSPVADAVAQKREGKTEKQKSLRHSRRVSDCSTPFLDTVFSGGLAKNNQTRESNKDTGPNWDDLATEDTSTSSSHSSVKHSGRRRTIHGIGSKKK